MVMDTTPQTPPQDAGHTAAGAALAPHPLAARAEQVGSLLPPPALQEARHVHQDGRLSTVGLRTLEDHLVLESLEQQRRLGVDVLTDGEYRRGSWLGSVAEAVEGFVDAVAERPFDPRSRDATQAAPKVIGGRLRARRRLIVSEATFLAQHASAPFKITLPSPSSLMLASFEPGVTDAVYPDVDELLADVSALIRDELMSLAGEGTPYVQLDAPGYTLFADSAMREWMHEAGLDPDRLLTQGIAADNASLAPLAEQGVTTGIHLCRGSAQRHWLTVGAHESMAEELLSSLVADVVLLGCENEWADGFRPLRYIADDTKIVLGLVASTRTNPTPYPAMLRRAERAAEHHPMEQLAVSTQCGFVGGSTRHRLSIDDQWRKLELVVRLARDLWG
jgi:5-methyltetrahydropteroyltriglutamate--homocysteine methyltransferase